MKVNVWSIAVLIGVFASSVAAAQDGVKRRKWDQKKAVKIVKDLIALENAGKTPWDDIAWETDSAKATALARKERKPIFVFFFLKKNVGPANAPC